MHQVLDSIFQISLLHITFLMMALSLQSYLGSEMQSCLYKHFGQLEISNK